ncbi:46 kDa FK506-binding nuclear protein-like isoform X2 [Symsagittifera roscoffensis]|uniref:46 kDa FK506-binding nuclear protein-like isoform X2 n=1 Tax=Symsagittifera roscoffensis TaxID=84072 RepID=UPI00307BBE1F
MFWGLVIEPNKQYKQLVESPFHVSKACAIDKIGIRPGIWVVLRHAKQDFHLCHLNSDEHQQNLNLTFSRGEHIEFLIESDDHNPDISIEGLQVCLTGYYMNEQSQHLNPASFKINGALCNGHADQCEEAENEIISIKKRNMYQMDAEEEEGEEAELVVSRSKVAKTEADSSNAVTVSQLMGNLSKVPDDDDEDEDFNASGLDEDVDDDDDDDDDEEVDAEDEDEDEMTEEIQEDELAGLHEDANMSLTDLAKPRPPMSTADHEEQQQEPTSSSSSSSGKRPKNKRSNQNN